MSDRRPEISDEDLEPFREALRNVSTTQGSFEHWLRRLIRVWCRVFRWQLDVRFDGPIPSRADGRPGSGCVIAGAPHRAWVEPFLLVAAWPPDAARLVWLGDGRTMTGSWWRRWLLPRLGAIPISGRVGGPRAYAELAAEALDAGAAVVVFPETGSPSAANATRTISAGFAYVARRSGAPVIPVVFGGTHRIVRGSFFSVDVLSAIDVGPADADPFRPAGRAAAHELAERFETLVSDVLPERNAEANARRPRRERWRWLGGIFK